MKITNDVRLDNNLDMLESGACGIHPEGEGQMIRSLTLMYSDAKQSVIREYVANGLDSHRLAGVDEPVRVSLPNELVPMLTIRDVGVGLSRAEILDVYRFYGASTKRDDNNQIGAFGLGAKVAYTVSDQFFVTATKDGWTTQVLFHIGEGGAPAFGVLSHAHTGERNGVEVSIPATDALAWRQALDKACAMMPAGAVEVDGKPVAGFEHGPALTENLFVSTSLESAREPLKVSMGGIVYAVPKTVVRELEVADWTLAGCCLVVPMGSVDLTPSRESVRDTVRTLETVRRELGKAVSALTAEIAALEAIENPTERVIALAKVPDKAVRLADRTTLIDRKWWTADFYRVRSFDETVKSSTCQHVSAGLLRQGLVLVHAPRERWEAIARVLARFRKLPTDAVVVFVETPTGHDGPLMWPAAGVPLFSEEEVRADLRPVVRKPRPVAPPKVAPRFDVTGPDGLVAMTKAELAELVAQGKRVAVVADRGTRSQVTAMSNWAYMVQVPSRSVSRLRTQLGVEDVRVVARAIAADELSGTDVAAVADSMHTRRIEGWDDLARTMNLPNLGKLTAAWLKRVQTISDDVRYVFKTAGLVDYSQGFSNPQAEFLAWNQPHQSLLTILETTDLSHLYPDV